jgi:hypothetical protein
VVGNTQAIMKYCGHLTLADKVKYLVIVTGEKLKLGDINWGFHCI